MRKYSVVFCKFWIDPKIQALSVDSKLLALYLLTGPHTNMLGCFRLPAGYIAEDLEWDLKKVKQELKELINIRFVTHDEQTGWLFIRNYLKWNSINSPNQVKSIIKLFQHIPNDSTVYKIVIEALIKYVKGLEEGFRNRLQTLSKPFLNQEQDQDQKQDQEQEQDTSTHLPVNCNPSSSVQQTAPVKLLLKAQEEIAIAIPLNDHSEFPISQAQVLEWQSLYPSMDVLQTLRKIRGWNLANIKKRKTKNGILKHITTWLAKEQDDYHNGCKKNVSYRSGGDLQSYNEVVSEEWLQQTSSIIALNLEDKKPEDNDDCD